MKYSMKNWPFRSFFSRNMAKSATILTALAVIGVCSCIFARPSPALDVLSEEQGGHDRGWVARLAAYAPKAQDKTVTEVKAEKRDSWSIFHRDDKSTVSIFYPHMDNPSIDSALAYWADVRLRTFVAGVAALGEGNSRYAMEIDYTLSRPSPRFASIVFRISTETGGTRPDLGLATFTYDTQQGKSLQYADIFSDPAGLLAFCSQYAREELTRRLPYEEKALIYRGTAPTEGNFAYFALRREGLEIFFPPYQVASSYLGEQSIIIPLEKLEPYGPDTSVWERKK